MSNADTIQAIVTHAEQVIAALPAVSMIDTEAALDDALASCSEGAVLVLSPTLQYPHTLSIPKPVTLQSATYSPNNTTRMTWDEPAPTFHGGIVGHMHDHALLGIAMEGTDTVGVLGGDHAIWDRCRLLGDPVSGAHRGIQWTGWNSFVRRCYIDDIFRPDQDTQAIGGWDSGAGLVIDDCYLSAAGQSVMFGGSDAPADRTPRVIWMHHSTLTKKPEWVNLHQCKTALEFKNCIDAKIEYCDLRFGGCAQGQGYYLIVATPRNQDGGAPEACVHNIEVVNCTGGDASGVANFLGRDNVYASGTLDNFWLHDCQFSDLDGSMGAGRVFLFGDAPANVRLQRLRISGQNHGALGYFYGAPPTGLVMTEFLELPPSEYGWIIDGDGSGPDALKVYAPGIVIDDTVQ